MATDQEIRYLITARDQASSVLRGIEGAFGSLSNAIKAPTTLVGGLLNAFGTLGLAANGIQALVAPFQGVASGILEATSSTETFRTSMVRAQGDVQKADAYIRDLVKFAAETPFELQGLQVQTQRLTAMGFKSQEIIPELRILGDAMAAMGGTTDGLNRAALALGQIQTRGKLSAQELNQLTETGIPAYQILQEKLGLTAKQMGDIGNQGISAQVAIRALNEGLRERFGGAMADQMQTLAGRMSNVKDATYQLQAGIGTALSPALKEVVSGLGTLVANVQAVVVPALQKYGPQIAEAIGPVVRRGVELASTAIATFTGIVVGAAGPIGQGAALIARVLGTALNAAYQVVLSIGQSIYTALQWINPFARHSPSLVEQVNTGVGAIVDSFGQLQQVAPAIQGLRYEFQAFQETTDGAISLFGDRLPKALNQAIAVLGEGARPAFFAMRDALEQANEALRQQEADVRAAREALEPYKQAVDDARAALDPYQRAIEDAKGALQDQQRTLKDLQLSVGEARDALEPLKDQFDELTKASKDAESAIRDLVSTPLEGEAAFDKRITDATNSVREQELALQKLKNSDAYRSLGTQIETAQKQLRSLQHETLPATASTQQRAAHSTAVDAAQRTIDTLKDRQQDQLDPVQRELDTRKERLASLRVEREATIDAARDRLKAEGRLAQGIEERSETDIRAGIAAAKAAKAAADVQLKVVTPAYQQQQQAVAALEQQITAQQRAVQSAQQAVDDATAAYDGQKRAVDDATTAYTEHKQAVDDLSRSYQDAKREVADTERQFRQAIAAAKEQAQAIRDADKAAKDAAKNAGGAPLPGGSIIPVGTVGVSPEDQQALKDMQQRTAGLIASFDDTRKKAETFFISVNGHLATLEVGLRNGTTSVMTFLAPLREQLAPVLATVGEIIQTRVAPALRAIVEFVRTNPGPVFAGVAAALGIIAGAAIVSGIVAVASGIGTVGLAIAGISVAVTLLTKGWQDNWLGIRTTVEAVWGVIGPLLGGIKDALLAFAQEVLPEFVKAWDKGAERLGKVWELIRGFFTGGGEEITTAWRNTFTAIKNLIGSQFDVMGTIFGAAWKVFTGIILAGLKLLQGDWRGAWKILATRVTEAGADIRGAWERWWTDFKAFFKAAVVDQFFPWGKDIVQGLIDGINSIDLLTSVKQWLTDNLLTTTVLLLGIGSPSTVFYAYGKDVVQGFWNGISDATADFFANIGTWITTNVLTPFLDLLGIGSPSTVFFAYGQQTIQGFWDGIFAWSKDFLKNLTDWIVTNAIDPVRAILGIGHEGDASGVFLGIGKDTISGLWEAIDRRGAEILTNIKQWFVDNVIVPVRAILGIPGEGQQSFVFWQVGIDTINGVLEGLTSTVSNARSLLENIGKAIIDGIKTGWDTAFTTLKETVEAAITGLLEWVKNTVGSFKMPTISLPTLSLPGQAATASTSGSSGGTLREGGKPGETPSEVYNFLRNTGVSDADARKRSGLGGGGVFDPTQLPAISPSPWVRPLAGYTVTQEFGRTAFAAANPGIYPGGIHTGIDLAAPTGTAVLAAQTGRVVSVAHLKTGFGNHIIIDHNGVRSLYGHLATTNTAMGQVVRAGELIGSVDSTGSSTGAHLHFETQVNGQPRNPRDFVGLRAGGWITEPIVGTGTKTGTRYLLGEDEEELVVPRSKMRRATTAGEDDGRGGGDAPPGDTYHLTVNVNGTVLGDDRQRLARELVGALRTELLRHKQRNGGVTGL